MTKDLKRYKQAYNLRIKGKTFTQIGSIMGVLRERARVLNAYYYYKKHKEFYSAK